MAGVRATKSNRCRSMSSSSRTMPSTCASLSGVSPAHRRLGVLMPFAGRYEQLPELRRHEETLGGSQEGDVRYPLCRYINII